mmetsp:Transcript_35573/g.71257  ORF Transcript_35573/g.71257 Transcript_35573/m.71257 type:complete len:230 (-) Transcript_35573:2297-2986(-)
MPASTSPPEIPSKLKPKPASAPALPGADDSDPSSHGFDRRWLSDSTFGGDFVLVLCRSSRIRASLPRLRGGVSLGDSARSRSLMRPASRPRRSSAFDDDCTESDCGHVDCCGSPLRSRSGSASGRGWSHPGWALSFCARSSSYTLPTRLVNASSLSSTPFIRNSSFAAALLPSRAMSSTESRRRATPRGGLAIALSCAIDVSCSSKTLVDDACVRPPTEETACGRTPLA